MKEHWEGIYQSREATQLSWYQPRPNTSLELIEHCRPGPGARLIDVGGGTSLLVDCLLDLGFKKPTVLDLSSAALQQARERLGDRAVEVEWVESDVRVFRAARPYDLWHDRAAFHFLVDAGDRHRYVEVMNAALRPGGHLIIGAFAPDGPKKCSGLEIVRYDAEKLGAELGEGFILCEQAREVHRTPAGKEQAFGFYRYRKSE